MVTSLPFWNPVTRFTPFLHNVFLCLWRRRPFEFRNERKRRVVGGDGFVHESSVSSPESE